VGFSEFIFRIEFGLRRDFFLLLNLDDFKMDQYKISHLRRFYGENSINQIKLKLKLKFIITFLVFKKKSQK
jgi:hypothetical protein